ncbi:MAG: bifunctional homocysteine S-methyltransferase/methylenetetrahydrofolate reductase [Phototrophicales bacterium]|nr:MAG: bifunctional homocysteine S-methyltransferase/methylenetetrahydrofolate reductase [Phototrophicales bacterium]
MTKPPFLERIAQRPLLADGAMGTMLHQLGVKHGISYDALNLSDPHLVGTVHRRYIEAGAELIETNTFSANAIKLKEYGLEHEVVTINEAGVDIAKQAIAQTNRSDIYIGGSVGPLGIHLAPLGRLKREEAKRIFHAQIATLIHAGVDVILLETFTNLAEIQLAIEVSKSINPDIPVIASMTFTRDDRTLLGETPITVAHTLAASDADVIGVNCSGGPAQLRRILKRIRQTEPHKPLIVMPNAGWPENINGRLAYPSTPEYFAEYAIVFETTGACIIGGCCGTTPEHIAAMRQALNDQNLPHEIETIEVITPEEEQSLEALPPTELAQKLVNREFVVTVEMAPPRGCAPEKVLAAAEMLHQAGATNINVSDSPMARMRMSPWALAYLIQERIGIETVLHFPTRGRNLLRVQGDLLAAHALGVRNIFVVMGDPTHIGDYPDAFNNHDIVPSGLIRLIKKNFNEGIDQAGNAMNERTGFLVGTALNLNRPEMEKEVDLLHKKIEAGADFALTQPIYDPRAAERFIQQYETQYGTLTLPIIVGLLPLYSIKHASFLHNEVPGIDIPEHVLARVANAEKPAAEGVKIAQELTLALKDIVNGIYLMPPFAKYYLAADVIDILAIPTT